MVASSILELEHVACLGGALASGLSHYRDSSSIESGALEAGWMVVTHTRAPEPPWQQPCWPVSSERGPAPDHHTCPRKSVRHFSIRFEFPTDF